MKTRIVLIGAVVLGWAVCAQADTITVSNTAFTWGDSFTIPTTTTDWLLVKNSAGDTNRKAGGTSIFDVNLAGAYYDGGNPKFTYTDGTSPVSASNAAVAEPNVWYTPLVFGIHVNAGAGQVLLWTASDASQTITATLTTSEESVTQAYSNGNTPSLFAIDYNSTQAQDLTLSVSSAGNNHNGWVAVSITEVPEPTAIVLLASALVGLLAYAWRKQR